MYQNVKLKRGVNPTRNEIIKTLTSAKMTYEYARYTMDNGKYLTINFMRDNTYEIATNHMDYGIVYDIKVVKSIKNFYGVVDFVARWLPRLNK